MERLEAMRQIGNEWQKNGHHRIYFNEKQERYGLVVNRYNSGNISSATLNGEEISNSQARRLCEELYEGKIWYDVLTGKFMAKGLDREMATAIWAAIETEVGELVEEQQS